MPFHPQPPPPVESWLGSSFTHSTDSYPVPTMCQAMGWAAGVWFTGKLGCREHNSLSQDDSACPCEDEFGDFQVRGLARAEGAVPYFGGKTLLYPSPSSSLSLSNGGCNIVTAINAWLAAWSNLGKLSEDPCEGCWGRGVVVTRQSEGSLPLVKRQRCTFFLSVSEEYSPSYAQSLLKAQ